jgi:hypothetical protein
MRTCNISLHNFIRYIMVTIPFPDRFGKFVRQIGSTGQQ